MPQGEPPARDPLKLSRKPPAEGQGAEVKKASKLKGLAPVQMSSGGSGNSSGSLSSQSGEGRGNMCIPTAGCGGNVFAFGEDGLQRNLLRDLSQCLPTKAVNKGRHQHLNVRKPPGGKPISYKDLVLSKEPIGKGGQGVVRKAHHAGSNTCFAMKELYLPTDSDTNPLQPMQRELERVLLEERNNAETMRQLEIYTVQNYEAYWLERKGKVYILMEWMEHGSLLDVLAKMKAMKAANTYFANYPPPASYKQHNLLPPQYVQDARHGAEGATMPIGTVALDDSLGRFSMEDLSNIAHSVLSGLVQLQHLGLVHNDIKPSNILVGRNGEVKISDFGVAKWTDSISIAGSGTGSFHYMAPERVLAEDYSYQADIFSLGLALAHCALGKYPLVSASRKMFDVLAAIPKGRALVMYPSEANVDPAFQDFTWQCMIPTWASRPTARDLLSHPFITSYQQNKPSDYRPGFLSVFS